MDAEEELKKYMQAHEAFRDSYCIEPSIGMKLTKTVELPLLQVRYYPAGLEALEHGTAFWSSAQDMKGKPYLQIIWGRDGSDVFTNIPLTDEESSMVESLQDRVWIIRMVYGVPTLLSTEGTVFHNQPLLIDYIQKVVEANHGGE